MQLFDAVKTKLQNIKQMQQVSRGSRRNIYLFSLPEDMALVNGAGGSIAVGAGESEASGLGRLDDSTGAKQDPVNAVRGNFGSIRGVHKPTAEHDQ